MLTEIYDIRPAAESTPVHASITSRQVEELADKLCQSVAKDKVLGPVLMNEHFADPSDYTYIASLFWKSALLKMQIYHDRPIPRLLKRPDVLQPVDIERWLTYFSVAAKEALPHEAVAPTMEIAEQLAEVLRDATLGKADKRRLS